MENNEQLESENNEGLDVTFLIDDDAIEDAIIHLGMVKESMGLITSFICDNESDPKAASKILTTLMLVEEKVENIYNVFAENFRYWN